MGVFGLFHLDILNWIHTLTFSEVFSFEEVGGSGEQCQVSDKQLASDVPVDKGNCRKLLPAQPQQWPSYRGSPHGIDSPRTHVILPC